MRRREEIWRKYKTDSIKIAFIKARSKYKQRIATIEIISNKLIECRSDTRKLYSLVNGLIRLTNDELAEEFVTILCLKLSKYVMT